MGFLDFLFDRKSNENKRKIYSVSTDTDYEKAANGFDEARLLIKAAQEIESTPVPKPTPKPASKSEVNVVYIRSDNIKYGKKIYTQNNYKLIQKDGERIKIDDDYSFIWQIINDTLVIQGETGNLELNNNNIDIDHSYANPKDIYPLHESFSPWLTDYVEFPDSFGSSAYQRTFPEIRSIIIGGFETINYNFGENPFDEEHTGCKNAETVIFLPGTKRIIRKSMFVSVVGFNRSTYAGLKTVILPDTVEFIKEDVFNGCQPFFYIVGDSEYLTEYAKSHGFNYSVVKKNEYRGNLDIIPKIFTKHSDTYDKYRFGYHTRYINPYEYEDLMFIVRNSGHEISRISFHSDDDCGGVLHSLDFYSVEEFVKYGDERMSHMGDPDLMTIKLTDGIEITAIIGKDSLFVTSEDKEFDLNEYLIFNSQKKGNKTNGIRYRTV